MQFTTYITDDDYIPLIRGWRRREFPKFFADGDVHMYFNPYDSPYDAFINFMNVLTDLREHVLGAV